MAEYSYPSIENVAVNIVEDSITLNMHTRGAGEQKNFNFDTSQKEDIANLIASYSPAHQNWQRVGEAKIKSVSLSMGKNLWLSAQCEQSMSLLWDCIVVL